MAGKVNDVPALAVLKEVTKTAPGDAVLKSAELDRKVIGTGEPVHQLPQHLPLPPQIEWITLRR